MPAFPPEWMDELHARNDIVSVVGEYLSLSPKGGRYWGLCPFHGEKTPSFSVSMDKQLYYCFGCHVGGDVIHFVRSMEKISYIEAVKHLAARVNLTLPDVIDDKKMQSEREKRDRMLKANQEAARWYHQTLRSPMGAVARNYLQHRDISQSTMVHFGVGACAPQGNELSQHLLSTGHKAEDLVELGLIRQTNGRSYDAFRGRVIFPIIAGNRQVIGFGGRIIGEGQPKYLNSQESLVFNKRKQLFSINMLRAKTLPHVILVEGYMDVISLYQAGVSNAVATLGTALTEAQARLIKRYTPRVYLAYDGDTAGQNANLRSLDILQKQGLEVFVMLFPNQQDPDDFIRQQGLAHFETQRENALPFNSYKLYHLRMQHDLSSEGGREAYAKKGSALIESFSPVEQERYYQELSEHTRYSVEALREEGMLSRKGEKSNGKGLRAAASPSVPSQYQGLSRQRVQLERIVIASAVGDSERVTEILPFADCFRVKAHRYLLKCWEKAPGANPLQIMEEMEEDDRSVLAAAFVAQEKQGSLPAMRLSMLDLRRMEQTEQINRLRSIADSTETDIDRRMECIRQIQVLQLLNEELEQERISLSSDESMKSI